MKYNFAWWLLFGLVAVSAIGFMIAIRTLNSRIADLEVKIK